MFVRTFPVWEDGKLVPYKLTAEEFFRTIVPFFHEWRGQAGRFNHFRGVDLRGSPDGTLVLFVRTFHRDVIATGRLLGGHHDAGEHSAWDNSSGYFLLDPATVQFFGVPIAQDELPWTVGRRTPNETTRPLDLGVRLRAWYIDSTPEQDEVFNRLASSHQPLGAVQGNWR